jgi:hypothetical protein
MRKHENTSHSIHRTATTTPKKKKKKKKKKCVEQKRSKHQQKQRHIAKAHKHVNTTQTLTLATSAGSPLIFCSKCGLSCDEMPSMSLFAVVAFDE